LVAHRSGADGRVIAIYNVANPDKLHAVADVLISRSAYLRIGESLCRGNYLRYA
jgi:hypothetical protein